MIPLFEKSLKSRRNGLLAALIVSIVYAAIIFVRSGLSIRLIFALLLFLLFYGFTSLTAYFTAVALHQKVLAILYNEADPEHFIPAYMPLLSRPNLKPLTLLTLKAHLANAYANLGQTGKAIMLLDESDMPTGRQTMDAELLIAGNRLSYYLLAEDVVNAEKSMYGAGRADRSIPKPWQIGEQKLSSQSKAPACSFGYAAKKAAG